MKIDYLGICFGTEPIPNMHHTSLVFEIFETLYFFDAGENCFYSAYTSGLDLSKQELCSPRK